jgi:hypothetical protein
MRAKTMAFIHKSVRYSLYCVLMFAGIAHAEVYVNTAGGHSTVTYSNGTASVSGNGVVIVNGKVVSGDAVTAGGPVKTEERALPLYDSLQIDAPVKMTYEVSGRSSLKVTAPSDVLPLLSTSVVNGRLNVALKGSVVNLHAPIRIDASGPSLQSVTISGAGAANLMNLAGASVNMNASGSSEIVATGSVTRLTATVSGSGRVNASLLQAEEISLDASGAGNISAFASRSVVGDFSGASHATVAGNPSRRRLDISGAANIAYR